MVNSSVISVIGANNVQNDRKPKGVHTLDEAVEEAKVGRCQIVLIFLTGIAVMGSVLENINVSYILPYAKCDLKLTTAEQGILSSISFLGIVFTSHFWGFLADTWGRQKVMRTAALGGSIFAMMSGFAANTTTLILFRFISGAFLAGGQAGAYSYISEFHTPKTARVAAAMVTVFMSGVWIYMSALAMFLIPMDWVIPIFSLDFKPWRLFLICNASISVFNAIVFSYLPESPKFLLAMNQKEEAIQVLSRVYAFNTGNSKKDYPVKDIAHIPLGNKVDMGKGCCNIIRLLWSQTKPIFQRPLLSNTWKLCYIIFVVFSIGHGTFMWFPDFLTQTQNYVGEPQVLCGIVGKKVTPDSLGDACDIDNKNTTIFNVMFFVGIFFIVISTASTLFMKIIEPKKLVCGWLLVSMGACILMNYITEFYPIFITFIVFLSCCTCANVVMAVAVNLYPTQYRAMATSFILMCGRLGGVAGSNIVGLLLEESCSLIFYLFSGVLITCAFVFILVKTNQKEAPAPNVEPK